MTKYCCWCKKPVVKDSNLLLGTYSHISCDDKVKRKIMRDIKHLKNTNEDDYI